MSETAEFYWSGINAIANVMRHASERPFFGNLYVDDGDGPRCAGRASPGVIDYTCLDDNSEHEWASARDYETGEYEAFCRKCGREWCDRDAFKRKYAEQVRWRAAMEQAVESDLELKAGVDYLRSPDNWDVIRRKDI